MSQTVNILNYSQNLNLDFGDTLNSYRHYTDLYVKRIMVDLHPRLNKPGLIEIKELIGLGLDIDELLMKCYKNYEGSIVIGSKSNQNFEADYNSHDYKIIRI